VNYPPLTQGASDEGYGLAVLFIPGDSHTHYSLSCWTRELLYNRSPHHSILPQSKPELGEPFPVQGSKFVVEKRSFTGVKRVEFVAIQPPADVGSLLAR